jgi:undecaprenyl diphosphate synthase
MNLLRLFIAEDLAELNQRNVKIRVIGERTGLEPDIYRLTEEAVALTRNNSGLTLVIAFNYGSRQEIASAARRLAEEAVRGERDPASITVEAIGAALDTGGLPDPDLVIRTSGEKRLSNFLLWQSAYSEFVFLPVLWPDFDHACMESAIAEFHSRERRFGGTVAAATG